MTSNYIQEGDEIADSPVGAGVITGITQAGYPQVNNVAVTWIRRVDGVVWDPHGHTKKEAYPS